jgi:hypothetical protein
MSDDTQKREMSTKFALDAIGLIAVGKPLDVCYRKLLAAANVLMAKDGQKIPIGASLVTEEELPAVTEEP